MTIITALISIAAGLFMLPPASWSEITNQPSTRLTVKANLNKETDSSKNEGEKTSSRMETETQTYDLDIALSNTGASDTSVNLEWYFFRRELDSKGNKGEPLICEKGSESISVAAAKRVNHHVTSEALVSSEIKTSSQRSGNNKNNSGGSKRSVSGDIFGGYIVLVRYGGEIIAKEAGDPRSLKDEWLKNLSPCRYPKARV